MRLTSTQLERTLNQFESEPIPDDHPIVPRLNDLFGNHTFLLDNNGLNIVEPAESPQPGVQTARIVNLANWSDGNPPTLTPHEPEPTDAIVNLGLTN